ncbi:MAG: alkaline phosphatase family protein [Deltaproteobacteria bacterium]|nr:alkaline phosphatase family protein [Deltaproteobacteria bacterium]
MKKVIVIGLDGLEPKIAEPMLAAGELPHLARLQAAGGYARVETTYPAQTPVAWSTFATGTNPGGHGIFDFVRRDPKTYLPDFSLNRYEQKSAYLPPKAVNLRRGTPLWELLSAAGIASTIVRFPCTFPPDAIRGRMLSGMGVPDLRGGLGTATLYTAEEHTPAEENEHIIPVRPDGSGCVRTYIIGPRDPKTRADFRCDITVQVEPAARRVVIRSEGQPKVLGIGEGEWSDWLRVKFKTGLLQSVRGMVRFHLVHCAPVLELYASPVNFDPEAPMFPISSPPDYARELAAQVGTFYTTGMVEDHGGLNNGRFGESAYLDHCNAVLHERERMLTYELDRFSSGLLFCLFDTPDRVQHMFWRFRNGAAAGAGAEMARVIEEHYRACDAVVGRALERADDETLFIVLSDHGMNSFQRGVHLNTWLHDQGLLALRSGARAGDPGDFFHHVDWARTRAYALGLSGIYFNLKGREGQGVVEPGDAAALGASIAKGLAGLQDPAGGSQAIRAVLTRAQVYRGPYAAESPDLLVNFAAGYRVSWATALGGIPAGHFEHNLKKWAGDHIIDPCLVPGVLLMNRGFRGDAARLLDLAPTILAALGVPKGPAMEGVSLLQ